MIYFWRKPDLTVLVALELYQAQRDLLEAEKLLEYATALRTSMAARVARLKSYPDESID